MDNAKEQRFKELTVLDTELGSLKKDAHVYSQQHNSLVFFKSNKAELWSATKKELDDLKKLSNTK